VVSSTFHIFIDFHDLLWEYLYFLYVDDIHTPQETHLWASMVCYGDIIILVYVDDVNNSQEMHGPLWPVTGIASFFYTYSGEQE
jgi:hypothetical protein